MDDAIIREVTAKLIAMPKWKFKLKLFLTRYSDWHCALAYGMDYTWKPEWDVRIYWWIKHVLRRDK